MNEGMGNRTGWEEKEKIIVQKESRKINEICWEKNKRAEGDTREERHGNGERGNRTRKLREKIKNGTRTGREERRQENKSYTGSCKTIKDETQNIQT